MIFDRELFENVFQFLKPEEEKYVTESLEILNLIVDDLASVSSQSILDFRVNSQHHEFSSRLEMLGQIAADHSFDFWKELQQVADFGMDVDEFIHESDSIEPMVRLQLIQAASTLKRSVNVGLEMGSMADSFTEEFDVERIDLMWMYRMWLGKTTMANIAVIYLLANVFDVLPEQSFDLLVGAAVKYSDHLSEILTRMDQLMQRVEAAPKRLTPIDELFDE